MGSSIIRIGPKAPNNVRSNNTLKKHSFTFKKFMLLPAIRYKEYPVRSDSIP